MKRKKFRKPRDLYCEQGLVAFVDEDNCEIAVEFSQQTAKEAKRLHAWLGKAIEYLEQKERGGG